MRQLSRRHPIATFLLITYLATAAIFAVPFVSSSGIGLVDLELPGVAPFILLSTMSLALAAFGVTALAEGRDGVRELRRRVFHFRVHPVWLVGALILLPLVGLGVVTAIYGFDPVVRMASDPELIGSTILLGALVAFLLVNWWEEAAWTGFALDRLQDRIGAVRASVVTTWMQATLHLPLVFIADGVTDGRVPAEQVPFYLVALYVLPIPVRIIITWLYNASGRSVPVVGLLHAGLGITTGTAYLPVIAPGFDVGWVYAGFAVVALTMLLVTRGHLAHRRTSDPRSALPAGVAVASR